ncbi:MAG: hypothetical protein IK045_00300 [Bacteroidales bacterium]|nr:hypothetical protein [Bacteroidales bacterium]
MMELIKTTIKEVYEPPCSTPLEISPLDGILDSYTIPVIVEEEEEW